MILRFFFSSDLLKTPDKSIFRTSYLTKQYNLIFRKVFSVQLSSSWRDLILIYFQVLIPPLTVSYTPNKWVMVLLWPPMGISPGIYF